jgi:hypothetical protein
MTDDGLVERIRFLAEMCRSSFGVETKPIEDAADRLTSLEAELVRMREALESIAATACDYNILEFQARSLVTDIARAALSIEEDATAQSRESAGE